MSKPRLVKIAEELNENLAGMEFGPPVTHVYNPMIYARRIFADYVRKYGGAPKEFLFVGMNPGPWGMGQTGVPFGEVAAVRDWMGLEGEVEAFDGQHEKRPVTGLDCPRSEVSGKRLWDWAAETFGSPERFFSRAWVHNYCPLMFLEDSGRNRTPDKLKVAERRPLFVECDESLRNVVRYLRPRLVIGVGAFATQRCTEALDDLDVDIGRIDHPSPASPIANQGWAARATASLQEMGIVVQGRLL